jgi:uncharacterized protein (DUF58 family)
MTKRFDPTELAKYGSLGLVARKAVEGFLTGVHRSPFKGYSIEFAEHRQYYPGDEIRHIDWRAFGKTDRYYIKEYEEDTNLKAMLVLDASASMGYRGAQKLSKLEYAQQLAASLGYLLLTQLDAVGLLIHDDKPLIYLPPKTTGKHLLSLLQLLEKAQPGGETSLGSVWETIAGKHLKKRGMVILFTDAFDQIEPLTRALRHLRYRNHEVILFQILAPEELDFPFKKPTKFVNLERPTDEWQLDARKLRDQYRKNFAVHQAALRRLTADLWIDFVSVRTDQPIEAALGDYLVRRLRK